VGLLVLGVVLQVRLWTGAGGMPEVWRLQERVADQRQENDALARRNDALAADVADLKDGREAVEDVGLDGEGHPRHHPGEDEEEGPGEARRPAGFPFLDAT
jgi:cell division protein FtsB